MDGSATGGVCCNACGLWLGFLLTMITPTQGVPADRVAQGPLRPISRLSSPSRAICADMPAAGASVGSRVATNELRAQQLVLGKR